jgi:HPt (histidine-containing phosphotransfer) domain-containing protein
MHISPDVSSSGVDVSLLEYISDGTDQGLSHQIELFLTALLEAEKQLSLAALNNNLKLLGDAAHGVLSHARLVGSSALATAAADLQHAAQTQDRGAFGEPLLRVSREIQSLKAVVRRYPGAERPA